MLPRSLRFPAGSLASFGALLWALALVGCQSTGGSSSSSGNSGDFSGEEAKLVSAFPSLTFNAPLTMIPDPSDGTRWFIAEKGGQIWWVSTAAPTVKNDFGTVPGVNDAGEGGLLGMAFHPNYPSPADLYVSYTVTGSSPGTTPNPLDSRISRFDVGGDDLGTESVVLELDQPYTNHNGGNIVFGPEGYLYIGFGDGGSGGDPLGNGQDLTTWLGKLLRIDIDGTAPYEVPADNPFVGGSAGELPEIYAYGLRNPWRFSFDRDTDELWLADVGQGDWEEVDVVDAGDNLGWNIMEGAHCYNAPTCSQDSLRLPAAEYAHAAGNCSITGGYVYRGTAYPQWQGLYFYGDYCTGSIWTVPVSGGTPVKMVNASTNILGFAEVPSGDLYVLTTGAAAIYRLVPAP